MTFLRKTIVATNAVYAFVGLVALLTSSHSLIAFALLTLGIGSWTYHYFDDHISVVFDHFAMIYVFALIGAALLSLSLLWPFLLIPLGMVALYRIPMFAVVGAFFAWAMVGVFLSSGWIVGSMLLAWFGLSFAVQRYAEPFKYTDPEKYNFWHSVWHIMSGIGIWGMLITFHI